eukprot:gene4788-4953_t
MTFEEAPGCTIAHYSGGRKNPVDTVIIVSLDGNQPASAIIEHIDKEVNCDWIADHLSENEPRLFACPLLSFLFLASVHHHSMHPHPTTSDGRELYPLVMMYYIPTSAPPQLLFEYARYKAYLTEELRPSNEMTLKVVAHGSQPPLPPLLPDIDDLEESWVRTQ